MAASANMDLMALTGNSAIRSADPENPIP